MPINKIQDHLVVKNGELVLVHCPTDFEERFESDDDSGAFVMKADAMPKRFADRIHEVSPLVNERFGMREWRHEQQIINRAYELLSQGHRPPSRMCNRVHGPDSLERWIGYISGEKDDSKI